MVTLTCMLRNFSGRRSAVTTISSSLVVFSSFSSARLNRAKRILKTAITVTNNFMPFIKISLRFSLPHISSPFEGGRQYRRVDLLKLTHGVDGGMPQCYKETGVSLIPRELRREGSFEALAGDGLPSFVFFKFVVKVNF